MAEKKVGDVLARFTYMTEDDVLDFQRTGRLVLVAEDSMMELPLPRGKAGEPGPPGKPGGPLRPDLGLSEPTDGEALEKLQSLSRGWRSAGRDRENYFAYNIPTRSGFFYTRGGWIIARDVFGVSSEIVVQETRLPLTLLDVAETPSAPEEGVTLFSEGGVLKKITSDGTVSEV